MVFGHKPEGEGRPLSFHRLFCQLNKPGGRRKAALLSLLGFGKQTGGAGRPRSFHPSILGKATVFSPLGFGYKPRGEGRPRSFHLLVLAKR